MNEQISTILNSYTINKKTVALLPAANTEYQTIVIEVDKTYYVNKKPMQLLESACIKGGASYDGRRMASIQQLGVYKKVPVAINTYENIYAFPTCSPALFHCQWIFYAYIQKIEPVPKVTNQCNITFTNGSKIIVNASPKTIKGQIHKTAHCIHLFSQQWKHDL